MFRGALHRCAALAFLFVMAVCAQAQRMEFSFTGLTGVTQKYLTDGTTLVQLPAGTDLTRMSTYGMSVTADDVAASLSDIVPNPSTKTNYVDGGLNVFYYKGKAYKVRFSAGEYFTAVLFNRALYGGPSSMSQDDLAAFATRVTKMGTADGPNYTFDALPGYVPTTDIAFFMGDMNAANSPTPIIHTLGSQYQNVVAKCAVVTGRFDTYGTNSTVTEYGLCYGSAANPTIESNTYKAAADIATTDDTFGDELKGIFGVYFDNLTKQTTYHVRAYCKYTMGGTSYTIYGEDVTITTPNVSGMTWAWEGGETPSAEVKARIEEAMNGAKEYYNNYCTLYKWAGTCYNSGVPTADCSLRADGSCYIRFGPVERYQWVGTAQHELSHGYGVGQTSAYAGYSNPFKFARATLTLRVFLQDMTMLISHDGNHYWPGGINQREEVTNGTANSKGTYTCKNEEMLKCNAMILNGLALDGMKTTYGVKVRNDFEPDAEAGTTYAKPRKVTGNTTFETALNAFNTAGIPLILSPGEIDLASAANADGKTLNTETYAIMTRALTEAQTHGVSDVNRFTNGQSTSTQLQAQPFAFQFKGVRFYNGQSNWFYEPMYNSGSTYRWIVPDAIYTSLQTYVNSHKAETSIWMQHLPMSASDADWYTSKATYNATNISRTATSAYNSAAKRRSALSTLISSTAHAAMFSGHADNYADNNYNSQFHDYTVPNLNNTPGDVLIVLMKAGTGVVEVKRVDFRDYQTYAQQYEDPATELTAGEDNAVLAGLVQGITDLNTGDASLSSAVQTGKNATTTAAVSAAITSINTAFTAYANAQDSELDVSQLLGLNLDFSTPVGAAHSARAEVFKIPGWNTYMNAAAATWQFIEYKTDLGSPSGGNALYVRENWKGNPALPSTLQVYKDAVLPAGTYRLSFEMRQPSSNATSMLNYYELGGVRTDFSAGTSWETKTFQLSVSQPTTLRLSFGFVGTTAEGNYPCEVDVDNVRLILVQREQTTGKASMADDGWTQLTALPSDYSPYFFTLYDHTQDLGLVQKAGANQGTAYKTMWYTADATPGLDKNALWTFDSTVADNVEYVVMASANDPDYMMQTEWNAAWHFRTHDNGGNGDTQWGRTLLAYNNEKWTIQNGKYPDAGYLGAWSGTIADGAEVALNKTGDATGYFDIYSMLRGQYVATYESLSTASDDNPLNISYVLENPGGERRSTIGWKNEGNAWETQTNTSLTGKVGGYYLQRWAAGSAGASDLYQVIQGLPDGRYRFSAIATCSNTNCYLYANDVQTAMPASTSQTGARTNVLITLSGDGNNTLRIGAKSLAGCGAWVAFDDARLEYLGRLDSYFVGQPTISLAEGDYIQQLTTVTYNFNLAASDNAEATFALLSSTTKATLKKGSTTVAEGTLSLNDRTVTATFTGVSLDTNSNYTLTLPADAVGYAGQLGNEAVSLTLHTPLLFDTSCYLLNNTTQTYLSRNGSWNTRAVTDNYGLAVQIVTDTQGKTHLRQFDNQLYVYSDGNAVYADGGTGLDLTPVAVGSNSYRFQTTGGYLGVSGDVLVADASEDASSLWTLEPLADHVANYTRLANAQAATAATAASIAGVTTAAQLESVLTTGYLADALSITGAKAERFETYGNTDADGTDVNYYTETLTGIAPGLYRVSVDAFQRAAYNEWVAAAGGARGLIMLFANDTQTQLKSVMDYGATTAYASDYALDGLHYPNNETSAYVALETGNYQNVAYVYVPADEGDTTGTLTFGIRILNRMGNGIVRGTWAAYENFKVEHLMPVVTVSELATAAPAAASNVAVRLQRTIAATSDSQLVWNTLCLPFSMTAEQVKQAFGDDVVVKQLSGATVSAEGNAVLSFKQSETIEAHLPYILKTSTAGSEYTIKGVSISTDENPASPSFNGVSFVGNYVNQTYVPQGDYYLLSDVFKQSKGTTRMKGLRGYFHVDTTAGIKSLGANFDGEATGIEEVNSETLKVKTDDEVFDLSGRRVASPSKGLYIVNGKKVWIR